MIAYLVQNKQDCPEDSGHWELFKEAIDLALLEMRSPVPDCQIAYAGHCSRVPGAESWGCNVLESHRQSGKAWVR